MSISSSTRFLRRPWFIGLLVLAGISAGACQRADVQSVAAHSGGTSNLRPTYDKAGQLTRLEYASKGDGKIDTWGYMDGTRVVRVEVDEDGDGKVDRWEYHSQGSQGSGGSGDSQGSRGAQGAAPDSPEKTIERIERATRHDGTVSRWEYFTGGVLTRVEEDTDGDGKIDKWETYTAGALSMMALDSQHRGTPDRRLLYRADGSLDRVETDPTGSGNFQPLTQSPTR